MRVGIVCDSGGPLYCSVYKNSFWVINGDWELGFDGLIHDGKNDRYIDYEIVLEDMDNMDYNEACELIRDAYKKLPKDRVKNDREKFVAKLLNEYKAFATKHIDEIGERDLFNIAYDHDLLITDRPTKLYEDIKESLKNTDNLDAHGAIKAIIDYGVEDDDIPF